MQSQADVWWQIHYLQLPETIWKMYNLTVHGKRSARWSHYEYEFVFSGTWETHVQRPSLHIDLYYIKQAVPCQDNSGEQSQSYFLRYLNDVMCSAINQRGVAIRRNIWHSCLIPGANCQRTAALDRGTNLSFALRYPPDQFKMPLKAATPKQHRHTCESSVSQYSPHGA